MKKKIIDYSTAEPIEDIPRDEYGVPTLRPSMARAPRAKPKRRPPSAVAGVTYEVLKSEHLKHQ